AKIMGSGHSPGCSRESQGGKGRSSRPHQRTRVAGRSAESIPRWMTAMACHARIGARLPGRPRLRGAPSMTICRSSLLVAAVVALGLPAAPAQAQLARTFVSSFGNDLNDCNRTTPCRTFQRAHDTTLAAGEITVLDPGGYGAVAINKAISIIND